MDNRVDPSTAEMSTYPSYAVFELWKDAEILEIVALVNASVGEILDVDSSI